MRNNDTGQQANGPHMDDQRTDQTSFRHVMRTARMVALMLVCAGIGNLPQVGDRVRMAEQQFEHTLVGAFCGLGLELLIRGIEREMIVRILRFAGTK